MYVLSKSPKNKSYKICLCLEKKLLRKNKAEFHLSYSFIIMCLKIFKINI